MKHNSVSPVDNHAMVATKVGESSHRFVDVGELLGALAMIERRKGNEFV